MSNAEWITDRLPTEADGDRDGDVRMVPAPGADTVGYVLVHWSYVGSAAPWQRTSCWEPPAEPAPAEPTPAEPDRIAALEQRVGELEAQMRPTAETFEQPELSYQRAKAEQLRSQAALLLAQANLVEAGQ
jgi:hypothetical protein